MRGIIVFAMLVAAAVAANTFCVDSHTTPGTVVRKDCGGPNLKCFKPKAGGSNAAEVAYGCGTCEARKGTVPEATDDNCEECDGDMCNSARKCMKTQSSGPLKSEGCPATESTYNCFSPADKGWTNFEGWNAKATAVGYGCGTCADRAAVKAVTDAGAVVGDCKVCATAADDCNTKLEMSAKKCYAYTWETAKKVFKRGAETDCKVLKKDEATAFKCSEPVHDKIKETDKDVSFGCGGCNPAGDKCKECNTDKCNSGAAGLISSLAVLIAAFYMLY